MAKADGAGTASVRDPVFGDDRIDKLRTLITPEGVPISVRLGERGERFTAVLIDYAIVHGGLALLSVLFVLSSPAVWGEEMVIAFLILTSFLLRNFYFTWFELRWDGRTPGKRYMSLRVIDANGGPLKPDAVIARNLTREIEINLPLTILFAGLGGDGWGMFLVIGWAVVFALMPLFNRNNLRIGDLIAGTWVIADRKPALLPDLTETAACGGRGRNQNLPAGLGFTEAQLGMYGVHELHVLERVLRQDHPRAERSRQVIANRIKAKIAFDGGTAPPHTAREFLDAFYTAQRKHLETGMLFGQYRETKRTGTLERFSRSSTRGKALSHCVPMPISRPAVSVSTETALTDPAGGTGMRQKPRGPMPPGRGRRSGGSSLGSSSNGTSMGGRRAGRSRIP